MQEIINITSEIHNRYFRSAYVFLTLSKCAFCAREVENIGFILKENNVGINPHKTRSIEAWEIPTLKRYAQFLLALVNYYRSFVKNCSQIIK